MLVLKINIVHLLKYKAMVVQVVIIFKDNISLNYNVWMIKKHYLKNFIFIITSLRVIFI